MGYNRSSCLYDLRWLVKMFLNIKFFLSMRESILMNTSFSLLCCLGHPLPSRSISEGVVIFIHSFSEGVFKWGCR
ncbi:hypothetical protein G4B88_012455 [Cannabis sativa]|uniref:Uncharacterized protein n=1 Tax=Cannabis sativa TaxID=3483 RepID=A0A7J6I7M1_CANSA|nr:hypothetical protein G4B88_012455 [Cannabis sativa]